MASVPLIVGGVSGHAGLTVGGWYIARDGHAPDVVHKPRNVPYVLKGRQGHPDQFFQIWGYTYSLMQVTSNNGVWSANTVYTDSVIIGNSAISYNNFCASKDLYAIGNFGFRTYLITKSDTSAVWRLDTAGLPDPFSGRDIALDSSGGVYIAGPGLGMYYRAPQSSRYSRITNLAPTYLANLSINQQDRIVVTGTRIYISRDHAHSWDSIINFPPGLIRQDDLGYLYSLNFVYAWRSMDTGATWTPINQDLIIHDPDTLHTGFLHNITGHSVLYAETDWGIYHSLDHGDHWLPTENTGSSPLGYWKFPNGRQLVANRLGLFAKNPNVIGWTKTFPADSFTYQRIDRIQGDTMGNVYIVSRHLNSNVVYSSSDQGANWTADTVGFSIYSSAIPVPSFNCYTVMENGDALFSEFANFSGSMTLVTIKKYKGGGFAMDTLGMVRRDFMLSNGPVYGYASDHSGHYYMAVGRSLGTMPLYVWKQSSAGGLWTADTLPSNNALFNIRKLTVFDYDQKHGIIGCDPTGSALLKVNQQWENIPAPPISLLGFYNGINYVAADSGGSIFAGLYRWRDSNTDWIGGGVVCSQDTGHNWSAVAGLDSLYVVGMQAFGDTTYVLATSGLYKMTCEGNIIAPTGLLADNNESPKLVFYPNPVTSTVTIQASAPIESVAVYDLQGAVLQHIAGERNSTTMTLSLANLAAGVYFIEVRSGSTTTTKRIGKL